MNSATIGMASISIEWQASTRVAVVRMVPVNVRDFRAARNRSCQGGVVSSGAFVAAGRGLTGWRP